MPPLSVDSPARFQNPAASMLVLRLYPGGIEPGGLEIGFGTIDPPSCTGLTEHIGVSPSLQLSVAFPRSGETLVCTVSGSEAYSVNQKDGPTGASSKHRERAAHGRLLAFSLDVLAPYEFSGLPYAPLDSIAASVAHLADPAAGKSVSASGQSAARLGSTAARLGSTAARLGSTAGGLGMPADGVDRTGRPNRPNDILMALWAAIEADLYRFAKDPGFTAALDVAATDEPEEYRRFARLNDLYRDMVKLLVPCGTVPRRWTAWLRGQEYRPVLPASLALGLEKFLLGRAGKPEEVVDSLATLLVRHGALVMTEQD